MKRSVFGTSVQGASHIRSGVECQDSYKKLICDDGTIVLAVADGHGSKNCPFSKTGSSIAVNVFCKIMSEYVANFAGAPGTLLTYLNREGDTKVAQAIDAEWKRRVYKNHRDNKRDVPLDENGEKILQQVYSQYGTTLLGLMLTETFIFAFQIGDGDIVFTSADGFEPVITGDKILGVETHSLSKIDAWKKAITAVRRIDFHEKLPSMFLMSSDGFANSYKNEEEFAKTCLEYFDMVNQYGMKAVGENLKNWLSETSAMGCGDDITVLMAYYNAGEGEDCTEEISSEETELVAETDTAAPEEETSCKEPTVAAPADEVKVEPETVIIQESEVIPGE
ncbi:MAG: PP2C family serine/threonine-protein phosphatase [Bacillota bacterium]|nr:PP2C family serine/threonine-protein phosphatase [Bacillota bacterium]